jgi:hemolysin activation/secretion protein
MYGTKLNLSYMKGLYVVGQELAELGMDGDTMTYGMSFSHPILREKNQNLTVSAGYDKKYSRIFIKDELENVDNLKVLYATLDYDSLDRYLGKNIVSLGFYHGKLYPDEDYPYSRKIADRRFNRLNLSIARIQKIYGNVNFMLRGLGQNSNNNLLPIEEIGIGGYGTVRGHNLALFLGDTGFTLSGELLSAPPFIADKVVFGQRISQMVQFSFFYDYGRVYYTAHLRGESPDERLNGYGAGIRLYYKDFFTFKFDLARPAKQKAKTEDSTYLYFMSSIDLTSQDFLNTFEDIKAWWRGKPKEETPAAQ